ncbi:hypothetical protein K1514_15495 [Paraclostridium bifermentans]|uniref:hypothetical protein n=1 Tax=Paraclostridium TaxID=1849822 RepID=UPI001CC4AAAA|nr:MULTISPECIES: hypothetical protein [Paraclostridium]MBZ6007297.1 hypothetical protein [Paraclostridium bifermentans]MDU0296668.1 hypothetical protein [Paraclostridium sp. MRS3W1]
MNVDNISKIVGVVVSIATIINTISKVDKHNKLIERYFDEALSVYVKESKKNKKINPVVFIKERFDIKDYFIPSYIFYLVDKSDKERLHKVLMDDYRSKFPSQRNLIANGIISIFLIIIMIFINIYLALAIVSAFSAAFMCFLSVVNIIFLKDINASRDFMSAMGHCIFIGIVTGAYVYYAYNFTEDDYTLTIKQIEKKIKKKVKYFDKKSIFWRLFNRHDDYYIN